MKRVAENIKVPQDSGFEIFRVALPNEKNIYGIQLIGKQRRYRGGTGPTCTYLVEGSELMVVDPATTYSRNLEEMFSYLEKAFHLLGYSLKDVELIVITHGHGDHYNLAGFIQAQSNAEVLVHRLDAGLLNSEVSYERMEDDTFLRKGGAEEKVLRQLTADRERMQEHFREALPTPPPIRVTRQLEENDQIGNYTVIHFPGHSAGSICLLSREDNVLLSGDNILKRITPHPGREISEYAGLETFLRSNSKMLRMNLRRDMLILGGHQGHLYNPTRKSRSGIEAHRDRFMRIYQVCSSNEGKTCYQIAQSRQPRIFRKLRVWDIPSAMDEVNAHLTVLEKMGDVEKTEREEKYFYRATGSTNYLSWIDQLLLS